jgi:hypothetical protein
MFEMSWLSTPYEPSYIDPALWDVCLLVAVMPDQQSECNDMFILPVETHRPLICTPSSTRVPARFAASLLRRLLSERSRRICSSVTGVALRFFFPGAGDVAGGAGGGVKGYNFGQFVHMYPPTLDQSKIMMCLWMQLML